MKTSRALDWWPVNNNVYILLFQVDDQRPSKNLIDNSWERNQYSDIVNWEEPSLTLNFWKCNQGDLSIALQHIDVHLQGAFKPIFVQLLLEVDHVSLLEAELAGVLGLEVVECLKDHLVKLVPIQPRTLHHFNIKQSAGIIFVPEPLAGPSWWDSAQGCGGKNYTLKMFVECKKDKIER